jgi:hypothetical protein
MIGISTRSCLERQHAHSLLAVNVRMKAMTRLSLL